MELLNVNAFNSYLDESQLINMANRQRSFDPQLGCVAAWCFTEVTREYACLDRRVSRYEGVVAPGAIHYYTFNNTPPDTLAFIDLAVTSPGDADLSVKSIAPLRQWNSRQIGSDSVTLNLGKFTFYGAFTVSVLGYSANWTAYMVGIEVFKRVNLEPLEAVYALQVPDGMEIAEGAEESGIGWMLATGTCVAIGAGTVASVLGLVLWLMKEERKQFAHEGFTPLNA